MVQAPRRYPSYPTLASQRADLVVHLVGLVLATIGGATMMVLASQLGAGRAAAVAVYAGAFFLMLLFSLGYNFSDGRRRHILRRLDHSGIFLMIAGSYTPFTTLVLTGPWAWGMTIAVWSIAGLGILGKIVVPDLREGVWTTLYLAMGWIIVIAGRPIVEALSRPALVLLVVGGLLYSVGTIFHIKERMQFSRSIWHTHVLAGATAHWAAILIGTVLPLLRSAS